TVLLFTFIWLPRPPHMNTYFKTWSLLRVAFVGLIGVVTVQSFSAGTASAQKKRRPQVRHLSVCGNPKVPCKTAGTFQPYDLPFRWPQNTLIYDTELFYAVVLVSVSAPDDSCEVFVSES